MVKFLNLHRGCDVELADYSDHKTDSQHEGVPNNAQTPELLLRVARRTLHSSIDSEQQQKKGYDPHPLPWPIVKATVDRHNYAAKNHHSNRYVIQLNQLFEYFVAYRVEQVVGRA